MSSLIGSCSVDYHDALSLNAKKETGQGGGGGRGGGMGNEKLSKFQANFLSLLHFSNMNCLIFFFFLFLRFCLLVVVSAYRSYF